MAAVAVLRLIEIVLLCPDAASERHPLPQGLLPSVAAPGRQPPAQPSSSRKTGNPPLGAGEEGSPPRTSTEHGCRGEVEAWSPPSQPWATLLLTYDHRACG